MVYIIICVWGRRASHVGCSHMLVASQFAIRSKRIVLKINPLKLEYFFLCHYLLISINHNVLTTLYGPIGCLFYEDIDVNIFIKHHVHIKS